MGFKLPKFNMPDLQFPNSEDVNFPKVNFPNIPGDPIPVINANEAVNAIKEKVPELGTAYDTIVQYTDVNSLIPTDAMPDINSMVPDIDETMSSFNTNNLDMNINMQSVNIDTSSLESMGIDPTALEIEGLDTSIGDANFDMSSELNNISMDDYMNMEELTSIQDEMSISNLLGGDTSGLSLEGLKEKLFNMTPEDLLDGGKKLIISYVNRRKEMALTLVKETQSFIGHMDFDSLDFSSTDAMMNNDYKKLFKDAFKEYLYEKLDNLDATMDISSMMSDEDFNIDVDSMMPPIDMESMNNIQSVEIDTSELESLGIDMPTIDMSSEMTDFSIPDMTNSFEMPNMTDVMAESGMNNFKIGSMIKDEIKPYLGE